MESPKKSSKKWLIILSIPVLLVVAAVAGIKLYFTSDRLKALILPKLQAATSRQIEVGDISLSLFPTIAVTLDNLTVSNQAGMKFDQPNILTLDELQINVKIWPLLQKKVEVASVILHHPSIYLESEPDETTNYSSKSVANKASTAGQGEASAGSLLLSDLQIENAEILDIDKKFDSRILIQGMNQKASAEILEGQALLHIHGATTIDKFSYGTREAFLLDGIPVTASELISYNIEKGELNFDSIEAKLRDLPLSVHGNITDLSTVPFLNVSVSAPSATFAELLSLVPPEMLKSAKGINSSGNIALAMLIKGHSSDKLNPGISGNFAVSNGTIQYQSLPKSITGVTVNGVFNKPEAPIGSKTGGTFGIDKFSATLGGSQLSGSLNVTDFYNPVIALVLNGSMSLDEVKEYYPLEAGTEVSGKLSANVNVSGPAKVPANLHASGSLGFTNVTIKTAGSPNPLQNLNGSITFNNQSVESKSLAMVVGQSDFNMSFSLKNYLSMVMKSTEPSATPSLSVTLTSKQIRTADLMSSAPETTKTAGAPKKSSGGMLLPGIDITANVTIGKLAMQKFAFTDVRGAVGVSKGIVTLQNFSLNGFGGSVVTKGMVDLRDTANRPFNLALNINKVDAKQMLTNFSSFSKYLTGTLTMNTNLKGDLDDTLGINKKTLTGDGKVLAENGSLSGFPLMDQLSSVTGDQDLKQLTFKTWNCAFTIADGRMKFSTMTIHSAASDFTVNGSQGLDGTMDYTLGVKLPASVSSRVHLSGVADQISQFFKDKQGNYNLNFAIGGTMDSPSVKLDTKAQADMAKQALKDSATTVLKKKAGDILNNFFKH